MYETIKTVQFGDTQVTIYKNIHGEYFAECENYQYKGKIPLGNDYQYIYDNLNTEIGVGETPQGEELLDIADILEEKLGPSTTYGEICASVEDYLFSSTRLWPSYVYEEIIAILDSRYARAREDKTARIKLSATASVEAWFVNAIETQRIYRLTTDEYEEQAVRIIGAHKAGNDYLLELQRMRLACDDNERLSWEVGDVVITLLSQCSLEHLREDELPPEYHEMW